VLREPRNPKHLKAFEDSSPCLQEPATGPILSQISPLHNFPSNLFAIYFGIIPPATPESFAWRKACSFKDQIEVSVLDLTVVLRNEFWNETYSYSYQYTSAKLNIYTFMYICIYILISFNAWKRNKGSCTSRKRQQKLSTYNLIEFLYGYIYASNVSETQIPRIRNFYVK
jgi:hypothetical protein